MTVKRISRHCSDFAKVCVTEVQTDTVTKIITNTEIEYRDTSFNIPVPPKIIYREKPVYIAKGLVNSDPLILETDLCKSISQVQNSKLTAELTQKDTTIRVELKNALVRELHWKEKYIKETNRQTVKVTENSNFAKLTIKVFFGLVIIVILGAVYLVLKNKAKILGLIKRIS